LNLPKIILIRKLRKKRRTFEKKIEFTENYFNPKAAEKEEKDESGVDSKFFYHFQHSIDNDPYEGEIIIPSDIDAPKNGGSPDAITVPEETVPPTEDITPQTSNDDSLSSLAERERLLVNSAVDGNNSK